MRLFPGPAKKDLCWRAFDGLKEPMALLDANGRVLHSNRAFADAGEATELLRGAPEECYVEAGGRVFERAVTALDTDNYAMVWHDRTAEAEATDLMKKHYSKMRRDIFHARNIQFSLIPREPPKAEGYEFASLYNPSEEMSGDIFDFVRIGRDNMAFYVADVAGHGVTASMLTIFFSTAVRLEMRPTDMPGRVLQRIHSRFMALELEEQHYITAFLMRLELSTGRLFWSNAGHICPPVLCGGNGETTTLEMPGLPICRWFEPQEYATNSGMLPPGGRLALFSDGLEARWNASGATGDLYETVGTILKKAAVSGCLGEIWRAADTQGKTQAQDDTTLLLISRDAAENGD